jgi:tetratricopeptide (TPR) repeat protein
MTPSPLDAALARAAEILRRTGFLPSLADESVWSYKSLSELATEATDELWQWWAPRGLSSALHRATIAGLFYRLSSTDHCYDPTLESEWRDNGLQLLRRFLTETLGADSVQSVPDLRWEIQASAASRDLERALTLLRLWDSLDRDLEYFHLAPRSAFLLSMTETFDWDDATWDLDIVPNEWGALAASTDLLAFALTCEEPRRRATDRDAAALLKRNAGKDFWSGLPVQRADALRDELLLVCRGALNRLGPERSARLGLNAAIGAWADARLGNRATDPGLMTAAAAKYESCAATLVPRAVDIGSRLLRTAAHWFLSAREPYLAERAVRKWIESEPDSAEAHKYLARCYHEQGKTHAVIETFETYVRLNDNTDEDWLTTFFLGLGLNALNGRRMASALNSAAMTSTFRPQGIALVSRFQPWLNRLCSEARDLWWSGLYTVTSTHHLADLGEDLVIANGADAFGEAVSRQLRATVFLPFASAEPGISLGDDDHWRKCLNGKATLGTQVGCLIETQQPKSNHALRLRQWLQQNRPSFSKYLTKAPASKLNQLWKIRGSAQHESISQTDLDEIFRIASDVLEALAGGPSDESTQSRRT